VEDLENRSFFKLILRLKPAHLFFKKKKNLHMDPHVAPSSVPEI
jgi:hypothetical protein